MEMYKVTGRMINTKFHGDRGQGRCDKGTSGTSPELPVWKQGDGHLAVHYIALNVLDILDRFSWTCKIIQNNSFKGKLPTCSPTLICVLGLLPFSTAEKEKVRNHKGNQLWILIERTDAEAETPVFWLSDVNSWLIGKVPDAGKG